MPTAKVRLLSPQVLLATHRGTSTQSATRVDITLGDGTSLSATYCPCSNLPYFSYTGTTATSKPFWPSTFDYSEHSTSAYTSLLDNTNHNLTAAQKDVLHWHQRLSHASIPWVQTLMHPKRNHFPTITATNPVITSKYKQGPTCNLSNLKCQACLFAKAHKRPHNPTTPGIKQTLSTSPDPSPRTLTANHHSPGDCISTDHYISSIHG